MMLGFLMMQPARREHYLGGTDTSWTIAAVPVAIVVLLTVLQVMLFTPHRLGFEAIAHQGVIGLIAP